MRERYFKVSLICFVLLSLSIFSHASGNAGSALHFDGTNGYIQVPHNAAFNSYPFTVTAWIRSTNISATAQGIVSQYADSSGNGWTLMLQNGHLRGFYYLSFFNFAVDATA